MYLRTISSTFAESVTEMSGRTGNPITPKPHNNYIIAIIDENRKVWYDADRMTTECGMQDPFCHV